MTVNCCAYVTQIGFWPFVGMLNPNEYANSYVATSYNYCPYGPYGYEGGCPGSNGCSGCQLGFFASVGGVCS